MTGEPTCPTSGKVRFDTQLAANAALLRLWKAHQRGDTGRRERSAYRCRDCDGFHLTSMTLEEQQARGFR